MFYEFTHRHTACSVEGQPDSVILSRETKATTVMGKEYVYNGLFAPTSSVEPGMMVETDVSFFVLTLRLTVDRDKYCSLLKSNAEVEVQRFIQSYDDNYDPVESSFRPVQANTLCFAQFVSGQMKIDDPGLLPTTRYVLVFAPSVDVKQPQDPTLIEPDRIILDGRPFQVDVIDRIKYPNLLHIQLSEDLR